MHRYWFEDAPGGLVEQFEYLRTVKRLTAAELASCTEGTINSRGPLPPDR